MAGIEQIHMDDAPEYGPVVHGVVGRDESWTKALKFVHHTKRQSADDTIRWADRTYPHHAPHRVVTVRLVLVEDES